MYYKNKEFNRKVPIAIGITQRLQRTIIQKPSLRPWVLELWALCG
jgi:hypothetical protein